MLKTRVLLRCRDPVLSVRSLCYRYAALLAGACCCPCSLNDVMLSNVLKPPVNLARRDQPADCRESVAG